MVIGIMSGGQTNVLVPWIYYFEDGELQTIEIKIYVIIFDQLQLIINTVK